MHVALARTKIHEEMMRMTIEETIKYYEENEVRGEFVIILEGAEKKEEVIEE